MYYFRVGLDVAGEIVDGVVVEKQAARIMFEKEVRKRIDPGFVELVTGNVFRTRVYPIDPHRTRTVRVVYQDQTVINNNDLLYRIPVQFQTPLESLDIVLTCFGSQTAKPMFQKNANPIFNQSAQFIDRGNGICTAEWHLTNVQPVADSDQILSYVLVDSLKPVLSAIESEDNLGVYFAVSCALPKPTEQRLFDQLDLPSRSICILWDASLSRSNSKENRLLEFNALKKIFDGWLNTINQIEIILIIFRNDLQDKILFQLQSNNWNEFSRIFEDLSYDGATNLSQLSTIDVTQPINYYFLFSDCISTISSNDAIEEKNFLSKFQAPLWVFNGNYLHEPFDMDLIRYLTEYNPYGGGYLNRDKLELSSMELATLIQTIPIKYVDVQPKTGLRQIYPSNTISIPLTTDRFLLVGQIESPLPETLECSLEFSMNNQTARVSVSLNVSREKSNYFGLIRRLWAQEKINELNIFKEKNKSLILSIGLEYSIVSHFTSLLVLETLQQHLQYHVRPAKTRTALYNQYLTYEVQEQQKKTDNIATLVQTWNERCQWYDQAIRLANPNPFAPPPTIGIHYIHPSTPFYPPPPPAGPFRSPYQSTALFGGTSALTPSLAQPAVRFPTAVFPSNYNVPSATTAVSFGGAPAATFGFAQSAALPVPMASFSSPNNVPSATSGFSFGQPTPPAPIKDERTTITLNDANSELSYQTLTSKTTNPASAYSIYLNERSSHRFSPSFYFDIASYFLSPKSFTSAIDQFNQPQSTSSSIDAKAFAYGLRILTNILELELEAPQLYRTVAYKLMELQQWNLALSIFRKIHSLRADEPQSLRDLAIVLMELHQYDQALSCLKTILTETWDTRFNSIFPIVLLDINRLLNIMDAKPLDIDSRLQRQLPMDIRIVAQWDTPDTMVGLTVHEPSGQNIGQSFGLFQTNGGGYMTNTFGQATSPIEYLLRRAVHGTYSISIAFQRNAQHTLTGVTTVLIYIYKYFGTINEEKQIKTIRLTNYNETVKVAEMDFNKHFSHPNITCDGCLKSPIIGDRYKCIYCPNIDFCHDCQNQIHHRHDSNHPLLCIHDSAPYTSSIALQNRTELIHRNSKCSLCSLTPIIGIRYQCTICRLDLCEKCEFLCLHDISHPRMKIILPS